MPRKSDPAYKTENSTFATRLREIMKERGENQTTLADKITSQYVTIQRQTISLYMSGQSRPDTERLTAIAKVLDISVDWLLGFTHDKGKRPIATDDLGLSYDAIMAIKAFDGTGEKETFDRFITDPDFRNLLMTLTIIVAGSLLHHGDELSSQIAYQSESEITKYVREQLGAHDAMIVYGDRLIELLKFKANNILNEIICGLIELGRKDAELGMENHNK